MALASVSPTVAGSKPKKLLDQKRDVLRLKHYSLRTERSYCDWIERCDDLRRIAMPRGSAFGSLSGISGTPVPSENLTVTGVEACTACGARVSNAAALDGVNVPVNKMPLAWPGLNPGCGPNMASNCFKISSLSAISFSSFGSGIVSLLLRA